MTRSQASKTDQGRNRRLGSRDRHGGPRPGHLELKAVLRRLDRVRRRAEQPCLAGRRGDAGHAAGHQRGMRAAGGAHRARPERARSICARCSTARTISIRICRRATRSASTSRRSWARARSWSNCDGGETVTVGIERLHLEQDAGKSLHDQHPTMSYVDLNRSGVALMEIVSKPDIRVVRAGQGLCDEAALDPALSRHLRRRHGEGFAARRRQRLRAQAGRAARHPLRDQEHELDPLHRPGDRVRGAAPDRNHRGRRRDRPGDAAVRSQQGRDALDALQGRGARLPLFPRSRPAAAGVRRRPMSTSSRRSCRNCRTQKKARFIDDFGLSPYDAGVLVAERESADFFETVLAGSPTRRATASSPRTG